MTKIEKLIRKQGIVDTGMQEIAYARGRIARACNRPQTGCLVPKFDTDAESDAWANGWTSADRDLAE